MAWILMILLIIFFLGLGTLMYGVQDIWNFLWESGVTMVCFYVSATILGTLVVVGVLEDKFHIKFVTVFGAWLLLAAVVVGTVWILILLSQMLFR